MNLIPKTCRDEGAYARDVAYTGKGSEEEEEEKEPSVKTLSD